MLPRSQFLDGIEPVELPIAGPELSVACGCVADHTGSLLAAEKTALARMRDVRAAEYSSGRRVARHALAQIGIEDWAVTSRGRLPLWPTQVVGSIAHSRCLALAMVGWRRDLVGVGVDLEAENRVTPRLADRVLVDDERRCFGHDDWPTMLFCAKEAVYKAVNPTVGEFINFEDVKITPCLDGTFKAHTTRPCLSEDVVAAGEGHFLRLASHWLSAFLVPVEPAR